MKTKLFDSDVLLMVRVQHAINDYLSITPYSEFTDYEHQLVSISSSIEKLLYLHTSTDHEPLQSILNKIDLERSKVIQTSIDKLNTSLAAYGFRHYILSMFKPKK